jgi:hypothetical protein
MGVKLNAKQIDELIEASPNTQMFDICVKCGGTEVYMSMNNTEVEDSFDVICDECLESNK